MLTAVHRINSFFPIKTISADLTFRQSDGLHQVIQAVIPQGGEILPFADLGAHALVAVAFGIGVLFQSLLRIGSLFFQDHLSGDQIQFRLGT